MGPDLLFITLLGLTITVHGQTPSPEQPSITTFLPDLIPEDLPAPGTLPPPDDGVVEPTPLNTQPAVKEAKPTGGPLAGNMEIPTMDFEQSENSSQTSPVISVSPTADPLPGQPSTVVKSDEEPSETSPPRNNTLVDLQNVAKYIQDQIRELDSQLLALDTAYRTGQITRSTRDPNAVANRRRRRQFEGDLRTIQQEISRLVPQPQPSVLPPIVSRSAGSASPSYEALQEELFRIRVRERYILRQLQMLSARNARPLGRGRLPASRNVLLRRRPITRRLNFSNTRRLSRRRTLTGSVAEGNVPGSRMRLL
ncbi:uncharacterized protein LOC130051086 [Ostrea edulis]|uniref:uncharacterized protein LOC130051086 n=1 Tax=Ostrea edulis TaxID=37623 RepID=UPI0024AEAAF2|nr:uncharacterized protein LOC130051086 [Ostrea edulis]